MYFCPNCNNVFDITKGVAQNGGSNDELIKESEDYELLIKNFIGGEKENEYENLITKILNNQNIDQNFLDKISVEDFIKSAEYKKLKNKQREQVYNKIQDLLPNDKKKIMKEGIKQNSEKAYFICNNCGNRKQIEEGTLIFSKVSADIAQSYSSSDVKNMKYSDILPRTSKYICPNSKCESHTNPDKREAIFFRMNNTFQIKHICQTCDAVF